MEVLAFAVMIVVVVGCAAGLVLLGRRLDVVTKENAKLITEAQSLQQQVGQSTHLEQLRKEFLQMIGHDVRTPLQSVQTVLAMLGKGSYGEVSDLAKERVGQARQSLTYVVSLINQLFEVENISSPEDLALDYQSADIRETCAKTLEIVKPYADLKKISVEVEDVSVEVEADHQRVSQVILNLVSNAVKHSPDSSVIRIRMHSSSDSVHVRISDEGPGLQRELRSQAFDRFTQFGDPDGGMGLGLAISKAIVEAHRGDIGFESQFGRGCCVWFRLPLVRAGACQVT